MTVKFVSFQDYQEQRGELNADEHRAVTEFDPSPRDIVLMTLYLHQALSAQGLDHLVEKLDLDYEVAAKINGALGERIPIVNQNPALPNWNWLLTEAYLLQGKNPDEIFELQFSNF